MYNLFGLNTKTSQALAFIATTTQPIDFFHNGLHLQTLEDCMRIRGMSDTRPTLRWPCWWV